MSIWDDVARPWRVLLNHYRGNDQQVSTGRIWSAGRTASGIRVTPDSALQNAVVWACIQYLTKTVAQLPWRVMVESTAGAERVKTNPVDWLIGTRPCPDMGSFTWRQTMLGNALLWGNAYAEIERDNRGAAHALWPIHPERVAVRRNEAGELEYEVWNRSGNSVLPARDMFHLRGFGDGPVGYNVIEYAAQSIGWAQATETFGATYFGSGANPSGVVETAKGMTPAGIKELRKAFNEVYAGPKGEKTVFLDNGMSYKKLSTDPGDSQFIETRQHQVDEICRWFGVPPHKVMHLLRATFSNIEHQSIEVVVDSVTPWIKAFEEEANYKLFGINRLGLYTKIDVRGLLRGDNASRAQYYKTLHELGALTINDIRALEDFNGIGSDGDVHFVSNNVQTLERAIAGAPLGQTAPDLSDPAALVASLRLN